MFSIISKTQDLDQIRSSITEAHKASNSNIPRIKKDVAKWTKDHSSEIMVVFNEKITEVEEFIAELRKNIEDETHPLSGRVYNYIFTTSEEIGKRISDIYQAIIQNTTIKDERTERLLIDSAGDLEKIFVSPDKGGHKRAIGDYPVPKPDDVFNVFPKGELDKLCEEYHEEFKDLKKKPSCFISYSWSHPYIVHLLSDHLKAALIDVFIDKDQGPELNRDLDKMEAEILNKDFILTMCSVEYGKKTRSNHKSGVRDEIKSIISRHTGRWKDSPVIRVLLSGRPSQSFPDNMTDDRSVYADLRQAKYYKSVLIKILERLYWNSVNDNPAHQAFLQKKNSLI